MTAAPLIDRRNVLKLAGGGVLLAATAGIAGCSSELPPEAVAAWNGPGEAGADVRRWLLGYAILAPHSHNLQSWTVDLRTPGEITLYCDRTRLLPETDPLSRQIMMSQGTFVELLDLAAKHKGVRADIELFPQGEFGPRELDARPTARIQLTADPSVRPDPLFAQIVKRHTNREVYEPRDPEPAALAAIMAATQGSGIRVGFAGAAQPELLKRHRQIAAQAWQIELTTPRTVMESYRVLRIGPSEIALHRDGLSINTPVVRALAAAGLFDRSKAPAADAMATTSQLKDFDEKLAATPAFVWLVTGGNDRKTQVNAGRAYVRAQLAATAYGLAIQPLSQALQEYPEQARPYADIHVLLGAQQPRETVQMWTRLGYGPAIGPSPRRDVESHVVGS